MSRTEPATAEAFDPTRALDGWQVQQPTGLPQLDLQTLRSQTRVPALPALRVQELRRRGFSMQDVEDVEPLLPLPAVPVAPPASPAPVDEAADPVAETGGDATPEPSAEAPAPAAPLPEFAWPAVSTAEACMPDISLASVLARARPTRPEPPQVDLPTSTRPAPRSSA